MKTDTVKVADLMHADVVTLDVDMTLRDAVEVLRGAGVGGAPVLQGTELIGVLSGTDILEFAATTPGVPTEPPEAVPEWGREEDRLPEEEDPDYGGDSTTNWFFQRWDEAEADVWNRMAGPETPEWDLLEEHTVDEVMSRDLVTVPSDAPLPEVAKRMVERRVHRVLVVDAGGLRGILSAFDLVRLIAERGL